MSTPSSVASLRVAGAASVFERPARRARSARLVRCRLAVGRPAARRRLPAEADRGRARWFRFDRVAGVGRIAGVHLRTRGRRSDVALGDAPARPAAVDAPEVDVQFAGEAADARRGEDAGVGCVVVRLVRGRLVGVDGLRSVPRGRRRLRAPVLVALVRHVERDDDVAHGDDLALLGEEFGHGPVVRRRHLDQRLIGFDLGDDLVLRDRVAGRDVPLDQFALRDPLADVRQFELLSHWNVTASRMPSSMRATDGR
jgi:hypothetical protein